MKTIIYFNKILGLILLPLVLFYAFSGFELTPKMEYLYYPELLGFWNDGTITEGMGTGYIFLFIAISIIMVVRYIDLLSDFRDSDPDTIARNATYNLSNLLDLGYAYVFVRLVASVDHVNNEGILILGCTLMLFAFIPWKIIEVSTNTERDERGAFNLRHSLNKYFKDLYYYSNHKERLINSYKKLVL